LARHQQTAATSTDQHRFLDAFVTAARSGDVAILEGVFAADAAITSRRPVALSRRGEPSGHSRCRLVPLSPHQR
jgi:hypothetical protein